MANQTIKRFVIKDEHGNVLKQDSFSVVGDVHVSVDGGVGEPSAESEYADGELTITLHNLKGEGISDISFTPSEEDGGENLLTITTDGGHTYQFVILNGSKGDKGEKGETGTQGPQGDSAVYNPDDPDAPDFEMANTTGQSTTKAMTQKAVTDNFVQMKKRNGLADLDLEDINGNVIGIFQNGHIKTKNFDSEKDIIVKEVEKDGTSDLDIQDGNGNVILRLMNGHIKTKNFDSSKIEPAQKKMKLKILALGNSFTGDAFLYLPFILKADGVDVEIGFLYKGGLSIGTEYSEYSSANNYIFYYIDTESHTAWQTVSTAYNPHLAVLYRDWDIITIQQGSAESVDWETYANVSGLIGEILSDAKKNVTIGWVVNHSRKTYDQKQDILANCQRVCEENPITFILPYGTAIFDARGNEILAAIGDGGDLWCEDEAHLQEGLPCYIASLTVAQAIFGKFYPEKTILNDSIRPTEEWAAARVPSAQRNGSSTGVTDANCLLAQKAAIMANKFNFTIKAI